MMADIGARRCKRSRAWHRAQWREHVDAQCKSGLSAAAYCRERGLARRSFYRWRRIFGAEEAAGTSSDLGKGHKGTSAPPVFAEVRVAPAAGQFETSGVAVVLGGERRLQVEPGFDEDTLRRVVAVLESLTC